MMRVLEPMIYPYHWDVIGRDTIPRPVIDEKFLEYRKLWERNPVERKVADFPLHLDIEVSGNCNLMCVHCVRHSRRTDVGEMDMGLFRRIVDEGAAHGLASINPEWLGESFLHPCLFDMVRYAKSRGVMDVRINSNCTLLDDEAADRLLDSGLDTLVCSIDAVTKKTYNRIKVGSDFDLVNRNIINLIRKKQERGVSKPTIIVQMIDMRQTHEELAGFIDFWRVRADRVRVAIYQSPDGRPNDKNRARNAPDSIFPCPQLWQRLVIAWDGTVFSCIGNNACRDPLGHVGKESLRLIWHGKEMERLRQLHANYESEKIEMCCHCDLNKIPATAKNYEGRTESDYDE